MRKTVLFIVAAAVLTVGTAGCSLFREKPHEIEKTAQELVNEGSEYFVEGRYKKAVAAFKDLRDWYPFSKYAILAELKIADAYYELESYEEAIFAYREFEKLHPKNEAIPHVIYRRGLCWYERIDTIDRDTEPAEKALDQFLRLKRTHPESPYAARAQEKTDDCIANLAGHELYVGNFYLKADRYEAALGRYRYVVEKFPSSEAAKEAREKMEEARRLAAEAQE